MKAAVVVLPVSVLLSVGLLGVIRVRRQELDFELKQRKFREIKMQVNIDLLEEGLTQAAEIQKVLEKRQSEIQALTEKHDMVYARAEQAKTNYEDCSGDQKLFIEQIGETQMEFSSLKNAFADERTEWKKQASELKEQLDRQSLVCNFLKQGEHQGRKLCGVLAANDENKKQEVEPEKPQEQPQKEPQD